MDETEANDSEDILPKQWCDLDHCNKMNLHWKRTKLE